MELTDGYVTLRPFRPDDVDALYEAVQESIAGLLKYMPVWLSDYTLEECRSWIESQTGEESYTFATFDATNNKLLGGCGLRITDKSFGVADLSYWMRTNQTKRGFATSAALLLVQFGFNELNLNRIEIVVKTDNIPSQRVAEKLGAIKEGVMRNRIVLNARPYDAVVYSLIPQDLTPKS
ncbi:MAG TPA: GNAT family N-acetyltransferase [Dehalococcoidia bacterium]|nr:GNAT family N-acetyltransferase [Dehalococcoidia bacterium]